MLENRYLAFLVKSSPTCVLLEHFGESFDDLFTV